MHINSFKNQFTYKTLHPADPISKKDIGYTLLENIHIVGRNHFYPNALLFTGLTLVSPYDEKIMSLNKSSFYDGNKYDMVDNIKISKKINDPVFFFIYNFDNYYHFLYDTLPYLYTYLYLKKTIPNLKLLVNYPNKERTTFYKFNLEFLDKLIDPTDMIIHDDLTCMYSQIYVSSSLTHGGFSNDPPRAEIHSIYQKIKKSVSLSSTFSLYPIKKVYISRRTWINNDSSNIGTDYTSRRKMMNEDLLVDMLREQYGFQEIFTENLSTDDKIALFMNADVVCGSIGGGMANLIFSPSTTKSIVLCTPFFLDINYRFRYSMDGTDITYFNTVETFLHEGSSIPLFCRVKLTNLESGLYGKIGEICEYSNEGKSYLVRISNNDVAGFNNAMHFQEVWMKADDFEQLDYGLNSPYLVDLDSLRAIM